jgi:sulfur relay protein TusB/DsrH
MSTLHLVSQSPALKACLSRVEAGDIILLLGAGACACLEPEPDAPNKPLSCYVLEDALQTHSIDRDRLGSWVKAVTYADFVEQVVASSRSLSWF